MTPLPYLKNVVIVAGHAGSGKTLIARIIAKRLGWTVLDKDTLSQPLVEALNTELTGNPHDRESATYVNFVRPLEYESLINTAKDVLNSGSQGVILVAPFVKELTNISWLDSFRQDCHASGAKLTVAWVSCEETEMRERITARNAERDRWKISNWEQWYHSLQSTPLLPADAVIVNNDGDSPEALEENARILISALLPRYH